MTPDAPTPWSVWSALEVETPGALQGDVPFLSWDVPDAPADASDGADAGRDLWTLAQGGLGGGAVWADPADPAASDAPASWFDGSPPAGAKALMQTLWLLHRAGPGNEADGGTDGVTDGGTNGGTNGGDVFASGETSAPAPADRTDQPAPDGIVHVDGIDALHQALSAAEGGETIVLAAGDYGTLAIKDWARDGTVTLVSADADAPASFDRVLIKNVAGLTLDGVTFDYTYSPDRAAETAKPFEVTRSTDVTIRNAVFSGDTWKDAGAGFGLSVRASNDILIENSEFDTFYKALHIMMSDGVTVRGNDMHTLRCDGINVVESSHVLIEDNHIHDFKRLAGSNDHADMIQVFTNGTSTPTTALTIRNNVLDVGRGDWTQSIFIRNEEVDQGRAGHEMYFRDFVIENNLIANSHVHGITIGAVDGLVMRNNTLFRVDDPVHSTPRLAVWNDSLNVTVTGNVAGDIDARKDGWVVADNMIIQDQDPNAPGYYHDHVISALPGTEHDLRNLQIRPDSEIAERGIGATIGYYDAAGAEALTAMIRPAVAASNAFTFDAGFTADALGQMTEERAAFFWDFGDGATATGQRSLHVYTEPGTYTTTLTVIGADGAVGTARTQTTVRSPDVLHWEAAGFVKTTLDGPEAVAASGVVTVDDADLGTLIELGRAQPEINIAKTDVAKLFDAEGFSLDMQLMADGPIGEAYGEIVRLHGSLRVEIRSNGAIKMALDTKDGSHLLYAHTDDDAFSPGVWHDLRLSYDGEMMRAELDGDLLIETPASGPMKSMGSHGLVLNGDFGARAFDGKLAAFDLDVNPGDYVNWGEDAKALNGVLVGAETFDGLVQSREIADFDPTGDILVLQNGASVDRIEQAGENAVTVHFLGDGDTLTLIGEDLNPDLVQTIGADTLAFL